MDSVVFAYFVTPHGFGHASRASAVMAAIHTILPQVRFEIFTSCPEWIFHDSIKAPFGYHHMKTDIGFVQTSPLVEDVQATCSALDQWLPFDDALVNDLSTQLTTLNCRIVICDISALGIVSACKASLPNVLIESFTWDWIYKSYAEETPELATAASIFGEMYQKVDLRIQTEPLCKRIDNLPKVNPIYRWPKTDRQKTRDLLGIPSTEKMVLVSMGGVPDRFEFLDSLPEYLDLSIVIPGADGMHTSHPKIKLLPTFSKFYHPDLLNAADVLIGKAGYSIIAEASHSGIPYGYILRPHFPETVYLERFIMENMQGLPIPSADHITGRWIKKLPTLLEMAPKRSSVENGAFQSAQLLLDYFL